MKERKNEKKASYFELHPEPQFVIADYQPIVVW